ncbi:TadA family conjugal transfer-associated ATPase [Raineyella fluvialis]|uniref:TadA family conjugal transfer-associated ATPase n=1 Tax=Raineyella fluvialis TaxID=2662261 RepID=A0A5Q2FCL9_9ACTN|nr:TadA family conjugal transfer-associated ATPase [Raineyella fluvialis]QGF22833.1 TadA family conjugal transfer-associated ATPase [Raineyella fluvialis]
MTGLVDLDRLRPALAGLGHPPTTGDIAAAMRAEGLVVTDALLYDAVERLHRESYGAGVLEPLLTLPGVTDVLVNGPDQVWIDRGHGLERTPLVFGSDEEVRRLALRLAARVGRRLDDAAPYVDARLPDGTRVHAVLGSVADPGTCISLRIPSRKRFTLADLVDRGTLPPVGVPLLEGLVERRLAFLVSGGTGSGKTTVLGTLLGLVPTDQRLVVVEDSRELDPPHPHCIRLEGRPPNAEGSGALGLATLVRQALRMRPDRVVVGEVRGAELCDLLAALNTGHEGGCGTVHANSPADVPARLEALAALGGMGREATQAQALAALHVVVHLRRDEDGRRRVAQIGMFGRDAAAGLAVREAVSFGADGTVHHGPAAEEFLARVAR